MEDSTDTYFNIFTVMFEIVSAYGSVGLSLGVPYVRECSHLATSLAH